LKTSADKYRVDASDLDSRGRPRLFYLSHPWRAESIRRSVWLAHYTILATIYLVPVEGSGGYDEWIWSVSTTEKRHRERRGKCDTQREARALADVAIAELSHPRASKPK